MKKIDNNTWLHRNIKIVKTEGDEELFGKYKVFLETGSYCMLPQENYIVDTLDGARSVINFHDIR